MPPTLVLVSTDLLAQSRVAAAAEAAGWAYVTAHPRMKGSLEGDLVVVDLDAAEDLDRFRDGPRAFGFYSHIDRRAKAAASRAGVEAIPRGRFWRELPSLLRSYDSEGES